MKRQQFRLGTVLRHYELRKQRAEYDLQQGMQILREIGTEIARLNDEMTAAAAVVAKSAKTVVSMATWVACYRQSDRLSTLLIAARKRLDLQRHEVAKLEAELKRWAVAEESMLVLRRNVLVHNRVEAEKAQQLTLDENVLRRRLGLDADQPLES